MKNKTSILFTVAFFVMLHVTVYSQGIGINDDGSSPDGSVMLDIKSTDKGILIPRIALIAKNNATPITSPATSLLVYNTATSGAPPNNVIPGYYYWNGTSWVAFETKKNRYSSIDAGSNITSTSTTDVQVTGMTVTPDVGTYAVSFNAQCNMPNAINTTGVSTADLCTDLGLIYNDINAMAVTGTHPLTFGSGETLAPGVYTVAGAGSIAGSLTLDGGGLDDPLFIIKCAGAFNTGAGTVVNLINGATPENIFWIAQDAIGFGASTTIQGTIISNSGAVSAGASCTITGRMFTKLGAVTFGPGIISTPANPSSHVNLRGLASFVLYTCSGGIGNTTSSTYNGDIATDLGAITGFTTVGTVVNGTIYLAGTTAVVTPVDHVATFSLYQNGILIPNSERTITSFSHPTGIYLHGISTVTAGQTIEVRWKVDTQFSDNGARIRVSNRTLTIVRVE
jgi:hypothetical protein